MTAWQRRLLEMKDDRKERIIKVKFSDEECELLLNKCGTSGLKKERRF